MFDYRVTRIGKWIFYIVYQFYISFQRTHTTFIHVCIQTLIHVHIFNTSAHIHASTSTYAYFHMRMTEKADKL